MVAMDLLLQAAIQVPVEVIMGLMALAVAAVEEEDITIPVTTAVAAEQEFGERVQAEQVVRGNSIRMSTYMQILELEVLL